jgi:hypothetical protein
VTNGTYRRSVTFRIQARNLPLNAVAYETVNVSAGPQQSVIYGTGDATGDVFIATTRTIPALTDTTFDLFSGDDFHDVFGADAPLRLVREMSIWIEDGGDESGVKIGRAASDCWPATFADTSDALTIYPGGGEFSASNPVGITVSNTEKNLRIWNLGVVDVNVRIFVAGSNAAPGVPMYLANLLLTYP